MYTGHVCTCVSTFYLVQDLGLSSNPLSYQSNNSSEIRKVTQKKVFLVIEPLRSPPPLRAYWFKNIFFSLLYVIKWIENA